MRLNYVRLLVKDMPACFRFYRDEMGLPVVRGTESDAYAELQAAPDVVLALFDRSEMAKIVGTSGLPEQAEKQDGGMMIFGSEDVDQTVAGLKARGVKFLLEPTDRPEWGVRTAHLRDPEGRLIELNSRLKK